MTESPYDIAAIGGGTAGLVTAAGAAGLGARAVLIERDRLGGDCLWTGCVPSKALISSARRARALRNGPEYGLPRLDPAIDASEVLASVREARSHVAVHDDPERFRRMGVTVIEGEARFVSPHEVDVGGMRVRARRFVIATGSRPTIPPIPGLEEVPHFTHAEAFDRSSLPASLAVIGGGPIGVELAQAYGRLGIRVTLVEMLDRILSNEEPELADLLADRLRAEGIDLRTGRRVVRAERRESGGARLHLATGSADDDEDGRSEDAGSNGGGDEVVEADDVLIAAGRRAVTGELDLDAAGVLLDDDGWVRVDERLRTSRKHIFAAGDVTGGYLFTHVADHEARTVVRNALFPFSSRIDYTAVPWCTFTDPELARVGLTEAEARDRIGTVGAHAYDLADLDRAIAERQAFGRVKIIVGRRGEILGGHILAADAGTMITEVALAMKAGARLGELSTLVHPYPTMSEGIRRAADAYRRSLLTGWRKTLLDAALRLGRTLPP